MWMGICRSWTGVRVLTGIIGISILSSAAGQLRIEIRRGVERPVPMAIVPFAWEGSGVGSPFDVAGLISADLGQSGRFQPMDVRDMVSRPSLPEDVSYQDWRIVEVDYLVIVRVIEDAPDRYTVVFQLFNVLQGEEIVGYRLTTTEAELRRASHRVSDMIFE